MDLFPSTLILCSDKSQITLKIGDICQSLGHQITPNNPDIFIIDQNTGWTIELVRLIKNFLSQKPFNHQSKIVIVSEIHNLNIESQNALLKTLEEPGENNYLIISTSKPSKILPTILSRCHIIKLKNISTIESQNKPIEITSDIKKNLLISETLSKNKDQVLPFLEDQLQLYQKIILQNPNQQNSQIIEKIIKAISMVNANVDPRSALDFIFLS
jgi:DNA polymerase III gamma/tau subunit